MDTQYDAIAADYQKAKRLPIFEVFEHTLLTHLGDVRGRSVLDLACGEGFHTRRLKQLGAGRTVGVDVSEQMLLLARQQEAREPLGIEYIHSPVQRLGRLGTFDFVTAVFLLNYAGSTEDLLQMCRVVHDHLAPGQTFFAINDNCGVAARDPEGYRQYGFAYTGSPQPADGEPLRVELQTAPQQWTGFEIRCFLRETYEWALRTAGFQHVRWHRLQVPPALEQQFPPGFWTPFLEKEPEVLIEARK
ncbi:class I SAM-dependent methyltransferase [Hyalangium sp.]|uniref:class I SAM-dependent methyltransferase n=1 Tax=Hyalangium sp. TaxID=2028555 RepID=UPI002D5AFFBF|nr:class I SAM-dependent methyltransferase [Hyalangium sp.]HYH97429.1 class I SAM-dependent methyltransferase [Hyalangium sp.]